MAPDPSDSAAPSGRQPDRRSGTDRRDVRRRLEARSGRRATDPTLTTGAVARRLGLADKGFIRAEILEGRLAATIIRLPGRKAIYRISEADFHAWRAKYAWKTDTPPQQSRALPGI